ncbi:wax ester/triacylglycerol synthase family O-acyltransferase [Antrihabitans sp. YC2-6]|uniref:WS/DGAT/MGAT family O-acyltransferase n=1 Tax=Antrihabitans sp. YC2-6 TaxID=2799498 RepID=UPI0018F2F51B|nr:wax ester/triacylglycerol synthase family O-acyltransferase [Antrihabitans sp. YC2-6]MBJ8343736.1 wax ester/triacylglycerol synthase family O-acyltransferase [Antrihabitans sp. YC2-6]
MELMDPLDAMFLIAESREHPMHVGALLLLEPPEGADPDYAHQVYKRMIATDDIHPTFLKRPAAPLGNVGSLAWVQDDEIDWEYHVRRVAMPSPGRIRELLAVVSRWHGTLLDRHRPLWECHIIEGLADGRVAIYFKVHHALVDGVSALRLFKRRLSTDPNADDCVAPWQSLPNAKKRPRPPKQERDLQSILRTGGKVVTDLAGLVPDSVRMLRRAYGDTDLEPPFAAPKTMFNVPIGGARRFAAQSWDIDRVIAVRKAAEVSVNDVVVAMCSGALRSYLLEHNALPDASLSAMVPISTRTADNEDAAGNAVGAIICKLGTDQADARDRLEVVHASMSGGKELFGSVSSLAGLAYSGTAAAPLLAARVPGVLTFMRQSFNVIISNVPGPREQMYWNGARLDGLYPVSVVTEGQALNITLTNTAGTLDFGVIGDRRSIPHLQHILTHLETGLADLEKAYL